MESNEREADGRDPIAPVEVTRVESDAGHIDNMNVSGWAGVIYCKAGTRRSSHYHLTDSHVLYVVSGRMLYWEQPVDGSAPMALCEVPPGEQVFTGPMVSHWTEFPVDTVLVSVSRLHRTHEQHEADLVRVEWFE
jgi:oxalate decarboxylase/phosphoglucose isomerase-like protein (cupin superfamily)